MPITPEFEQALARLADTSGPVPRASLYQLSDLGRLDLAALEAAWPGFSPDRRLAIVQDLSDICEANFEVNFDHIFRIGLEDESPAVRAAAIRGLWEAEDASLAPAFLEFVREDPDPQVRAAAASALGRFVYLGELEELPTAQLRRIEDALLAVIASLDELEVRRRALEAIAYSSRPEVPALIEEAYSSDEQLMRISAVFAMGRTSDDRWSEAVQAELNSPDAELRFEAARAAGELELTDMAEALRALTDDEDTQVRDAAIWSLSQVGGTVARITLTELLDAAEEEDERDYLEDALENLEFTTDMEEFSLFDFEPEDAIGSDEDDEDEDDD